MEVFLYGTLRDPNRTEEMFDVQYIGPAILIGASKLGNNVVPNEEEQVRGNLFEGTVRPIDEYEESFGYEGYTAPVVNDGHDEARFYAMPIHGDDLPFDPIEVELLPEEN